MKADSKRWHEVSPSPFEWEREALGYVRNRLPDHDPYKAWCNFEFIAQDGTINEVDLLVAAPTGLFLIEIKSWPGRIWGDAGKWRQDHEGRTKVRDNPLLLANRKAKKLRSLLNQHRNKKSARIPFVEALVFLSHEGLRCGLRDRALTGVYQRDEAAERGEAAPGLMKRLTEPVTVSRAGRDSRAIDSPTSRVIARAMEAAGIGPSQRSRRVGDYNLGDLLFEGPGYQDWEASHVSLKGTRRRIRVYGLPSSLDRDTRTTLERAAQREFQILEGIDHTGILKARDYTEHVTGPALIFEHHSGSLRLDHFLEQEKANLSFDDRLSLLRQLGEALGYAHSRGLFHRALSPASVLVRTGTSQGPRVQIFNWQTALRETLEESQGHAPTATQHLERLVEDSWAVYLAPETLSTALEFHETADVFSLGAVAYYLFSGAPPARSYAELRARVAQQKGLLLSSSVDGVSNDLVEVIRQCTHPDVTLRTSSVRDFLDGLEQVEDALTRPDRLHVGPPSQASPGDHFEGGIVIEKRLGSSSASTVFLATHDGKPVVLKLASEPERNDDLAAEGDVLEKLRHPGIVALLERVTIQDCMGLILERAGDQSLRDYIRQDGRLSLDFLGRFGKDLLEALAYLEDLGVPHRDIKPDNLGVTTRGKNDRRHLALFDFSLSRVPPEKIHAGTVPYLEPFLANRKPPRWDEHADRYAASVTLYEMATGTTPRWGDGRSDPAGLDCEVTVDSDLLEPTVRASLTEFFTKALRRDPAERFDNAEQMVQAWEKATTVSTQPTAAAETPTTAPEPKPRTPTPTITARTALAELGLSAPVLSAAERLGAATVGDLLALPTIDVRRLRGVGNRTRRELVEAIANLQERCPEVPPTSGPPGTDPLSSIPRDEAVQGLDRLLARLLSSPASRKSQPLPLGHRCLRLYLGLDAPPAGATLPPWPSQGQVARVLGATQPTVSKALSEARKRWEREPSLTDLRREIAGMLQAHERVMTLRELARDVLVLRGSAERGLQRERVSRAAIRAATELESSTASRRWVLRSGPDQVLLALASDGEEASPALFDYLARLGERAEGLANQDHLPSKDAALAELRKESPPKGFEPFSDVRLLQMAAGASRSAALSSRQEIYPRGMPALRALKLSQGALFGALQLTVEQLKDRVRARYPEAQPLPPRPVLDDLLQEAGLSLSWNPAAADGQGAYVPPRYTPGMVSTPSTPLQRLATSLGTPGPLPQEAREARAFETRLENAIKSGAYLVLSVPPQHVDRAVSELTSRFEVNHFDVEARLLELMKKTAQDLSVNWTVVRHADAQGRRTQDWTNLKRLVGRAMEELRATLPADEDETVLLTHAGLVARYDELAFFDELRERVMRTPGGTGPRMAGAWVLIPCDDQSNRPLLEGKAVPVITSQEWARIPSSWLQNLHRA